MLRLLLIFFFGVLMVLATISVPASEKVFPFEAEKYVLDNGLTVFIIPTHTEGIVSYYSVVRTGSRDEYEPEYSGFAYFF